MSSRRQQTVERLSQELRRWERTQRRAPSEVLSTGIPALDELLPDGGLHGGMFVEWLATHSGSGAGTLAILIAARLSGHHALSRSSSSRASPDALPGACVIVDRRRSLYPPALSRLGLDLDATIVVHPLNQRDELWALEQSLRCMGVSVVLGWPGLLRTDDFRRLQLAAEHGGGVGLLLRSSRHRNQPSWADLRLLVEPVPLPETDLVRVPPLPRQTSQNRADLIAGEGPGVRDLQQTLPSALYRAPFLQRMPSQGGQSFSGEKKQRPPHPPGRFLRIELLYVRGCLGGGSVILEIDDETGVVHHVSRVAPAAPVRRAAGA